MCNPYSTARITCKNYFKSQIYSQLVQAVLVRVIFSLCVCRSSRSQSTSNTNALCDSADSGSDSSDEELTSSPAIIKSRVDNAMDIDASSGKASAYGIQFCWLFLQQRCYKIRYWLIV